MATVQVYFANLGKKIAINLNAETSDVLRYLYNDAGTYSCQRNSDDEVLLRHRADKD